MKTKELLKALKCSISTPPCSCEGCKYRVLEEVGEDFPAPHDFEENGKKYWGSCNIDTMVADAIDKIESLKWHLVSEEDFPDSARYILLHFDNFSTPLVGRFEEGSFYIGDDFEPCVVDDIFVDAWMELPKFEEK